MQTPRPRKERSRTAQADAIADLGYWNGRFLLWCLSRRPAWAMKKDLRAWARGTRPVARA